MKQQEKLNILQEQYRNMLEYRLVCNGLNSSLNYSSIDFDRESMLVIKIQEVKDNINLPPV